MVLGFVVHARNWMTFNLVQTKKHNRLSFSQMKMLVFIQTHLRMLKAWELAMPFKLSLMKFTLPRFLLYHFDWKLKINILSLYEERAQPSQCVP
jgi:hypothetical protein